MSARRAVSVTLPPGPKASASNSSFCSSLHRRRRSGPVINVEYDMPAANIAQAIGRELPYLRRYARALTGNQTAGDNYAAATLEAILADRELMRGDDARVGLFRAFHAIWQSSGQPVDSADAASREAKTQGRATGSTIEC